MNIYTNTITLSTFDIIFSFGFFFLTLIMLYLHLIIKRIPSIHKSPNSTTYTTRFNKIINNLFSIFLVLFFAQIIVVIYRNFNLKYDLIETARQWRLMIIYRTYYYFFPAVPLYLYHRYFKKQVPKYSLTKAYLYSFGVIFLYKFAYDFFNLSFFYQKEIMQNINYVEGLIGGLALYFIDDKKKEKWFN